MFRLFGILLVGLVLLSCPPAISLDKHTFSNFKAGPSCFGLNLPLPIFEKNDYVFNMRHHHGHVVMKINLNGKEPIIKTSGYKIERNDFTYATDGNRTLFKVKLDYGQGFCNYSFDVISNTFFGDHASTAIGTDSHLKSKNTSPSNLPACVDNSYSWNNCFGNQSYPNGNKYAGEFLNNLKHGWGTYTHRDGMKYVGEFRLGKIHGQGTFTDVDGSAEEGIWRANRWSGEVLSARRLAPNSSIAGVSDKNNDTIFSDLTATRKEAESLRQELAALKAQQEQQQQTISDDAKLPAITITSATTTGAQGIIRGSVYDNTGVAELRVDGQKIAVESNGNFSVTTYVPEGGTSVNIEAIDLAGLSSTMSVRVDRAATQTASISFDKLNPLKRKAAINNDALALVIGVSEYKETNAKAIYADSDAKVFQDYAIEKLGVPRNRVKTLVNDGADEKDMLLATKRWLARAAKQGKTDVYIFFAGHGLASDDGSKMYLLPYDGAPELLDKTAILREELFADIASANPRSVTVFLDTCYSGTTRGTDMLIASRPIAIRALEQSIPDNFTVMTAAAGDQTAKPLIEAKHGMFSYFLMKGMEGDADANNDNEISAGELHQYVQSNVIQQSSGSQTPELQGDADRVLVRFQ